MSNLTSSNSLEKSPRQHHRSDNDNGAHDKHHTKSKSDTTLSPLNHLKEEETENTESLEWEMASRKKTKHPTQQQHAQSTFRSSTERSAKQFPINKKLFKLKTPMNIPKQQQLPKEETVAVTRTRGVGTASQHLNEFVCFEQNLSSAPEQSRRSMSPNQQPIDSNAVATNHNSTPTSQMSDDSTSHKQSNTSIPMKNMSTLVRGDIPNKKHFTYADAVLSSNPTTQYVNTSEVLIASPFANDGSQSSFLSIGSHNFSPILDAPFSSLICCSESDEVFHQQSKEFRELRQALEQLYPATAALDLQPKHLFGIEISSLSMSQLTALEEIHLVLLRRISKAKLEYTQRLEEMRQEERLGYVQERQLKCISPPTQ
jgi:hypothetical protein